MQLDFIRAVALDDIRIRSGGDGRTVEAYAAIFDSPTEIVDQDGHYFEVNSRAAFNKTISDNKGRGFPVIYHHGFTIAGTPSERGSVPIGRSQEIKIDKKGVLTISRYNNTELADQVLESVRNGDITGQSYGGKFIKSDPMATRTGYRPNRDGSLRTVTRLEIAMREFGPTPFPAYTDAAILGVRTLSLLQQLNSLTTPVEPEATDDTSTEAVVRADEPQTHSARPMTERIRAFRISRGIGAPERGESG